MIMIVKTKVTVSGCTEGGVQISTLEGKGLYRLSGMEHGTLLMAVTGTIVMPM